MVETSSHDHRGECRSCPVCVVLQVLADITPEVRAHLLAAGRELVLAARAAAAASGGGAAADDIWTEPPRGTPPGTPADERGVLAEGRRPAPITRLRRIAVE